MAGDGRRSAARHAAVVEDFGRWAEDDPERRDRTPGGWVSEGPHGGRPADDLPMDRLPQGGQPNGWAPEGWVAEPLEEWVEQDVPAPDLPGQDLLEDDQAGHDLPTGTWPAQDGSPECGEPEPAAPDDGAAEGWVMDDRYPVDRREEERGDDMSPADGRDPARPGDADPGQDAMADAGPAVPEPIQLLLDEYTARRRAAEDVAATAESIAAAAAERAAAAIAAAARAAEEAEAAADAAARASADAQAAAAAEQRAIAAAGGHVAPAAGGGRARRAPQAHDSGVAAHPPPDARASRSVPAETRPTTVRATAPRFATADPTEQELEATPEQSGQQPGGMEAAGPATGPGAGRRGPEPAGPPPGISRPVPPAGPPPEGPRGWLPQEAATAVFAAVPGGRAARRRAADGGRSGAVDADATQVLTGLESLRSHAGSGQPEPGAAEVTAITAAPSAGPGEPDDPGPQDLADDDREPGEDGASEEPAPRPRRAEREQLGGLAARLTTRPALATLAVVVVLAVAAVVTALTTSGAEPAPATVVDAASPPSAAAALPPPEVQAAVDVDPESDKAVEFLSAMRDADIPTSRSGQAETEAAAVICDQLNRGSDEDTLVRALPAVLPDVTRAQAGDVVGLAQKHYC